MTFFGPTAPLLPFVTIFSYPSLHVTAQKVENLCAERRTIQHIIQYLYASHFELNHKQMVEETNK